MARLLGGRRIAALAVVLGLAALAGPHLAAGQAAPTQPGASLSDRDAYLQRAEAEMDG